MKTPQSRLYQLTLRELAEARQAVVVGDLHGDYESLQRIRSLYDPLRDFLIFLGDYADRGPKGIEVIEAVRDLVTQHPSRVITLKGNHEDYAEDGRPKFMPCDLVYEAGEKRGGWTAYFENELKPFINRLHLAVLIPDEVLLVHGGVSSKVKGIEDLKHPSRHVEEDILWSDPFEGLGERPNTRGAGVEFGNDVSEEVCRILRVKRILRSHQPTKALEGPCLEHGGRIVTTSSTNVYGGTPFVLTLPARNLGQIFKHLEKNTVALR